MTQRKKDRADLPDQRDKEEISPVGEDGLDPVVADGFERDDEAIKEIVGTHGRTGRTYQSQKAAEEGLSYTPPRDPATIPSEHDPAGSEVAAGFAPSMEESDPDARILPERIDRGDLEIQEDVALALRYNSETANLTNVSALVEEGTVRLFGSVPSEEDNALVYDIVSELEGVRQVISHLEIGE
jgi:hypothetical protein